MAISQPVQFGCCCLLSQFVFNSLSAFMERILYFLFQFVLFSTSFSLSHTLHSLLLSIVLLDNPFLSSQQLSSSVRELPASSFWHHALLQRYILEKSAKWQEYSQEWCSISDNLTDIQRADAIVFHNRNFNINHTIRFREVSMHSNHPPLDDPFNLQLVKSI